MKILTEWFLRLALSAGFLSAVADRLGWWPESVSAWGNWAGFAEYTRQLTPWLPTSLSGIAAWAATLLEVLFGIVLLFRYKTPLFARASGLLLLIFGISMSVFLHPKVALDYSVFPAAAAAFALSYLVKE